MNCVNHVLSHVAGANDAANFALAGTAYIEDFKLYDLHYTLKTSSQKLLLGHIVFKAATEMLYVKRSSFIKDVTTENN